ncbi:MAG: signal peptidase II [Betaproteobacteria bacterium]
MSLRSGALPWFALAAAVVALDQFTKHVVQQQLRYGESVPVTAFLDLVLVFNPGAAFSFLSPAPGWQRWFFVAVALAASVVVTVLLLRHRGPVLLSAALGLILGGAIGNVIDRLVLGAVVDFLHFHAGPYYWPAFNVADSAITVGATLLVYDSFASGRRPPAVARDPLEGGGK